MRIRRGNAACVDVLVRLDESDTISGDCAEDGDESPGEDATSRASEIWTEEVGVRGREEFSAASRLNLGGDVNLERRRGRTRLGSHSILYRAL
jgi:hypothetical protein